MDKFSIGDKVYADDWWYGKIVEIEGNTAYVQFKTQRGGGCLPFKLNELNHEKWCITTDNLIDDEIMYLGWQNPAWDEDGYFWTSKEIVEKIEETNNTEEHPFIFTSKRKAIKHLKTLHIPQKCRVVRWFRTE